MVYGLSTEDLLETIIGLGTTESSEPVTGKGLEALWKVRSSNREKNLWHKSNLRILKIRNSGPEVDMNDEVLKGQTMLTDTCSALQFGVGESEEGDHALNCANML